MNALRIARTEAACERSDREGGLGGGRAISRLGGATRRRFAASRRSVGAEVAGPRAAVARFAAGKRSIERARCGDRAPAEAAPPESPLEKRAEASDREDVEAAVALAMRQLGTQGRPASEGRPLETNAEPSDGTSVPAGEPPGGPAAAGLAWAFRPTMPNIAPGSVQILAASGGRADAESPPTVSSTGGLVESLDAADVDCGLGRGGPVRSAVEIAARTENAPVRGSATFSVTIFSDGKVDVQVASNQTDWSQLIPAIREAVKKSQVRLHRNSRGLNVVVAVEAKVKYPDGYTPPEDGPKVTVTPSLDRDTPLLDVHAQGKRCWARMAVTPGGIAVGADCAVGGMARGVSTRIVSETRL